jgi:hypothetical protein
MQRSRKIFLLAGTAFLILLLYASYDIASRTTFPGAKPQLKERIQQEFLEQDSVRTDTTAFKPLKKG